MSLLVAGLEINLDPSWSSEQAAKRILESARDFYGDSLDVAGVHAAMEEIWVDLQENLTDEEKLRLREVVHVSIPLNDFNARIATPPSRQGYFILFDAMLDLRLIEIFSAPRNMAAWTAAYVRAAWGNVLNFPHWVGPALDRLDNLQGWVPDSYGVMAARYFIFAHECGHFFLDHLHGGAHRTLHFGSEDLLVFDPALKQEIEADAFAREILCRSKGNPLIVQQKGVDWLFGFMGAVLAMRKRAEACRTGDPDLPTMDPGMALRRTLCWEDYNRRRAQSPYEANRVPEDVATIDRLRQSVDNFNKELPAALAVIYAELPGELMELQTQVIAAPMTEDEVEAFRQDVVRLAEDAQRRLRNTPRRQRWRQRLQELVKRYF